MDCARDERIGGENNRSSADCHPKPKMGTVSNRVAGFTECFAECNSERPHRLVTDRAKRGIRRAWLGQ
jgi:hypothetical protein